MNRGRRPRRCAVRKGQRRKTRRLLSLSVFGVAAAALLAVGLSGCPKKKGEPPADQPPAAAKPATPKQAQDPAYAGIPLVPARAVDRSRLPRPPAKVPERVAARYILVKYIGADKAKGARLNKMQADKRARRLVSLARGKGASFVALARRHSEVPQAERGQQLIFSRGEMAPAFDKAAFGMGLGQVSDPVATKYGYYVIMRVKPDEYSSAHILIQYKGAKKAPAASRFTRDEARKKADELHEKASAPGANFALLAERHSESPSRKRGGVIRPIVPGQMPADYDNYVEALQALKVGQVSPVVETPFGFHIIKRLKLERVQASHILISYTSGDVTPREKRNIYEAKRLAIQVQRKAAAEGADFAALAKQYSDDPDTADRGGDVGAFARGTQLQRFEQIAFGLKVGQVSDVVETPLGFHIIKRTR